MPNRSINSITAPRCGSLTIWQKHNGCHYIDIGKHIQRKQIVWLDGEMIAPIA